jgi:hypothetical protein
MSDMLIQFAATIITGTLMIHGIALSFQLGTLLIDGLRVRTMPGVDELAAVWQVMGITCALCGFVIDDAQLIVFGLLFLALRLVLQPLSAPSWDRNVEQPLLILAAVSLGFVGVLRILPSDLI